MILTVFFPGNPRGCLWGGAGAMTRFCPDCSIGLTKPIVKLIYGSQRETTSHNHKPEIGELDESLSLEAKGSVAMMQIGELA